MSLAPVPKHPFRRSFVHTTAVAQERRRYLEDWQKRVRMVRCAGITSREAMESILAAEVLEEINQ